MKTLPVVCRALCSRLAPPMATAPTSPHLPVNMPQVHLPGTHQVPPTTGSHTDLCLSTEGFSSPTIFPGTIPPGYLLFILHGSSPTPASGIGLPHEHSPLKHLLMPLMAICASLKLMSASPHRTVCYRKAGSPFFYFIFYSMLLNSIQFYSILFYSPPFYSIRFDSTLLNSILFYSILFYSTLLNSILLYSTQFNSTLFYSTLLDSI